MYNPRPLPALCLILLTAASSIVDAAAATGADSNLTARGFGAASAGGAGGRVIMVTRLDDDPKKAAKGSLRWALKQKGPRIIRFAVGGDLMLRDHIIIREPFLTIDGATAPHPGICIRGGSLEFRGTHDIIVQRVRIRLGDENILRKLKAAGLDRPKGSGGLDCISLNDCQRVLFDHCSVSWSCDELFGIVRSRDVTLQWCILSEPLTNPKVHPYGNNHAYCVNASASTLSIHHCLFHRFVMRGPQFECNDMRPEDKYTVRMEAVNNVISAYTESGSRYSLGVEKGSGTGKGKTFQFQFINNLYLPATKKARAIDGIVKHGQGANVHVALRGNAVLEATTGKSGAPRMNPISHKGSMPAIRAAAVDPRNLAERIDDVVAITEEGEKLFESPAPITVSPAQDIAEKIIQEAGDSTRNDEIDARVRQEVLDLRAGKPVKTPGE
jgi:hypothetical protein